MPELKRWGRSFGPIRPAEGPDAIVAPLPVRILVADEQSIFRAALCELLHREASFRVAGEAADGVEAARLAREIQPDVLLLDLAMRCSREALGEIGAAVPSCRILVVAAHIDHAQTVEVLQLGARGVILKDAPVDLLLRAIRTVAAGECWVGRKRVADLPQFLRSKSSGPEAPKPGFGLTPRELEVIRAVVAGDSNRDIATRLTISQDTTKHHLSNIFNKLGVSNRLELALFAYNHRIVENLSDSGRRLAGGRAPGVKPAAGDPGAVTPAPGAVPPLTPLPEAVRDASAPPPAEPRTGAPGGDAGPGETAPVRLVIADDHQMFRAGLRRLLEAEPGVTVIGEAGDGDEAVALVHRLQPDLLLLDLAMPKMPGIEVIRELATSASPCRIILLTAAIEKAQIVEALQLGARGVVLKHSATSLLVKSIRRVMAGEYWVGRDSVADLVVLLRRPPHERVPPRDSFGLTPRELQVVATVVTGYANKDIAQQFSISEDTVKHHLSSIFDKLGVSNRLELALFAINHQLVAQL